MKPGATICPSASTTFAPSCDEMRPIFAILPFLIPMSLRKRGARVPSTTIPFFTTKSKSAMTSTSLERLMEDETLFASIHPSRGKIQTDRYVWISRGGQFWVIVAVPCLGGARLAGKALDDLIVVEFAQMVSGPMCGKMFADMGAAVIKIEPPGAGDEMRAHPPFPGDIPHPEKSGAFLYLNTSQKNNTPAHGAPTGAEVFRALIARADVLIENHPPGYLDSIGLGFDALKALNPRLILTSITPFGQIGP